jgi:hypothetical protein
MTYRICVLCCLILDSKLPISTSFLSVVYSFSFSRKSLDTTEVEYLCNLIWNFKPSNSTIRGMKKLELNKSGVVTMMEFELLCKHYPEIIKPLVQTRKLLRQKIIFPRFWKELTKKRYDIFLAKTILEIRGYTEGVDLAQVSMDYLNLLGDQVPYKFVEQWKTTQRKKQHSYQGDIELPYELWEQKEASEKRSDVPSIESFSVH